MILITITSILGIAVALLLYRKYRLNKLMKERNHLDLTTAKGRKRKDEINDKIDKMMFVLKRR